MIFIDPLLDEFINSKELVSKLVHTAVPRSIWHEQPYRFEVSYVRPEFESEFEYGKFVGLELFPETGVMSWTADNFIHAWLVYQYYTKVAKVEAVILWDTEFAEDMFCYCVWADTEELL
tara:strand:- start:2495 stop:2851 length:357 start_codon:yes stop_codon:yes gene_type:complete